MTLLPLVAREPRGFFEFGEPGFFIVAILAIAGLYYFFYYRPRRRHP